MWDKGFSCDNPLCSRFALASRRVGGPCVVTLACTGPPFGPQMIRESNVEASSFGAEWLAGTRHVNINVLEFASAVFALLLWAHHLRETVVGVGWGLVALACEHDVFDILYTSGGALFHPEFGQLCLGFPVSRFGVVFSGNSWDS